MKILITTLFFILSLHSVAQKKDPQWYHIVDSLGNSLYDSAGDYFIKAKDPFTKAMRLEIDSWLIDRNANEKFKSGVVVWGPGYIARKDLKSGKWRKSKK